MKSKDARAFELFLQGGGSNGKGVVFGILTALHGAENVSNVSLKSIMERPFALYDLVGKNCNLDVELSSSKIEDTAILKKITGRQLVRVEQKNQKAFDARIYAKVWLSANDGINTMLDMTSADIIISPTVNIFIPFMVPSYCLSSFHSNTFLKC